MSGAAAVSRGTRPATRPGVDPNAARRAEAALARDAAEVQRPGTLLFEAVKAQELRKVARAQALSAGRPAPRAGRSSLRILESSLGSSERESPTSLSGVGWRVVGWPLEGGRRAGGEPPAGPGCAMAMARSGGRLDTRRRHTPASAALTSAVAAGIAALAAR